MNRDTAKCCVIAVCCLLLAAVALVNGEAVTPEAVAADQYETRCGWFVNPTPANIWLQDRDGEWIIGVQGGYQVEGDWDWPEFAPKEWVSTNAGSYGYGCVCLQVKVDREARRVLAIRSARAQPLAVCRQDRALKRWKR